MCVGGGKATRNFRDILRPHRFFGLPSLIDPIVHNGDSYNNPDMPRVEKPVERQVSKDPNGRNTFDVNDETRRRRALAAAAIYNSGGAGGVLKPASVGGAKLGGG